MLHDTTLTRQGHTIADLNHRFSPQNAMAALKFTLESPSLGRVALVSSFGADAGVLLHMVAQINPHLPVLFLDTELLFPQTLGYQRDLARHLGLSNVQLIRPKRETLFTKDLDAMLHRTNPDACCALRKSQPLEQALTGYGAWITGRKRFQGGTRQRLDLFEPDKGTRIKINPLAHWTPQMVQAYFETHNIPRHPLVDAGYPSLGCQPCTTRTRNGEPPRAGRWRGQDKTECGIHFTTISTNRRNQ
ncbi:MAG: phosphoadenylyl-sulfate reductase [Paracoccaceae bacterium]